MFVLMMLFVFCLWHICLCHVPVYPKFPKVGSRRRPKSKILRFSSAPLPRPLAGSAVRDALRSLDTGFSCLFCLLFLLVYGYCLLFMCILCVCVFVVLSLTPVSPSQPRPRRHPRGHGGQLLDAPGEVLRHVERMLRMTYIGITLNPKP